MGIRAFIIHINLEGFLKSPLVPFWSLFDVLMTRVESPSMIVFFIPSHLRISRPSFRAPNSVALLVEFPILPAYSQMMLPPLSLTAPPIPTTPGLPFVAPSKFSLTNPNGGVSNCGLLFGVVDPSQLMIYCVHNLCERTP
jgi:hypothetical protein